MRVFLVAMAALALSAGAARAEDVAITFDDLPALSLNASTSYWAESTRELLAKLKRHHVPATGFVNEGKLEVDRVQRVALLRQWLDAGMDLGNHTYSHASFTGMTVDAYIDQVVRGEVVTRGLLAQRGRSPHWFRHPYLETGKTLGDRRQFEGWLAEHGYRVAPVSMENADWLFAYPYDEAIGRHDAAEAEHIKQEYLAYTAAIVPWYRDAALGLLGRRPAFVFLLHASRLNADSFDDLWKIFESNDLHPVSLDRAMSDPAYTLADTYAGPDGIQWLTRWSLSLNKPLPWASLPKQPPDMLAANKALDAKP